MSDKDKEIVDRILKLRYNDSCIWLVGESAINQVESDEAKEMIHRHLAHEYHCEEAKAGMI